MQCRALLLTIFFFFFAFNTVQAAPDLSAASGTLSIEIVDIPIAFVSDSSVVDLQFDLIYDPTQLTSGVPTAGATLAGHIVASNEPTPGVRRVVIYSLSNALIGDVTLVNIPFTVVGGAAIGVKPLTLSNIIMSNANADPVAPTNVLPGSITITDSDGDALADSWEVANFGDLTTAGIATDFNGDGLLDIAEYAAGTDPKNTDTDGDGMPDEWEVNNGIDPNDNGSINLDNGAVGDPDGDAATNQEERQAGSNPIDGNSLPVNVVIQIKKGLNLFSYPITRSVGLASYDLIVELGNATEILQLLIFDRTTGAYGETHYDGAGAPMGDNVAMQYGDGIKVYALVDKTMSYTPTARPFDSYIECATVDLTTGLNVAAFPCVPTGTTAYQLIQSIGDDTVISSIGIFNTQTGRFETAAYLNGQPAGSDFPINAGEAYLIFMKQDVLGVNP